MKAFFRLSLVCLLAVNFVNAQASYASLGNDLLSEANSKTSFPVKKNSVKKSFISEKTFSDFSILTTAINTKYSEIGSGLFMDKLIIVSSKKIGAFGNGINPVTNLPYEDLYCVDVKDKDGQLKRPLLFSRILNTEHSEGQATFTEDERTIYFTRNSRENPKNYQLYKSDLQENSNGNWINIQKLDISSDFYSVETPFLKGNKLYFSSNKLDSYGGFDLYVADIKEDGTLGEPQNLGNTINTDKDDKFPFITKDGKYLYFSSNGHETVGGFDVFVSRTIDNENGYKKPVNLGYEFNTKDNEIGFFLIEDNQGYVTSNKANGKGNYDIYRFYKEDIKQLIKGIVVDAETQIPLPKSEVILIDEEGREIGRQITNEKAEYDFPVVPFDTYTIKTIKEGFEDSTIIFEADKTSRVTYTRNLELHPTKAEIVEVDNKTMISLENIYFDFAKWTIRDESTISLNKVVDILTEYPAMKIEINAHTDDRGKDAYNLSLSEKRAASAMEYIISKGIAPYRLISHGYGETQPLQSCGTGCTEDQHQINRRIEFVVVEE